MSCRLTDDDLVEAERRARAFSGAWTGTCGTIASFLVHAVREIREQRMTETATVPPVATNPAQRLLEEASRVIAQRRTTYGPPRGHFRRTVAAINAIFADKLREPLTEADWAQIMILDKLARHQGERRSDDTPIDLAGYAACLAECEAEG